MRVNNLGIRLIMSIPFDRHDGNGTIYPKAAVERAFKSFSGRLPIFFCGNMPYEQPRIIGFTDEVPYSVIWNDETQTCMVTISGTIRYGGTECIINKVKV